MVVVMTLLRKNVEKPYVITDKEDDVKPQLISRHSSSLPINHKNENNKKMLSRRSRSASPCIKKTQSLCSGTTGEKRKIAKDGSANLMQLPVLKKQASKTLGKNFRAPRSSVSSSRQRVQVLSDHKKLKIPAHVWERLCAVPDGDGYTDINSNHSYSPDENLNYGKTTKPLHAHNQSSLSHLQENFGLTRHQPIRNVVTTVSIFDILPTECKLKIFTYLNQMEKGRCMFVSKQWYCLVRSADLWRTVNLREFVLCYGHDIPDPNNTFMPLDEQDLSTQMQCDMRCYGRYTRRMESYILFLIDVRPQVRRISISFDLANDSWMNRVKHLFRSVDFGQLVHADIDWHVTPAKSMWLLGGPTFQFKDVVYATRRRERCFLNFLEEFVLDMPNLKSLIVPFSWTLRAMRYLTLLPRLSCLVLKQYTVYCNLSQEVLDELSKMKCLEKLLIEVWISSTNPTRFTLSSSTLKYLDLSQCRNFHLQTVELPSLEVLKIERNNGACQNLESLTCLYDVLCRGAPRLRTINHVALESTSCVEDVFSRVCPCWKHDMV